MAAQSARGADVISLRIMQGASSLLAIDCRLGVTYSSGQTAQSFREFSYSTGRGDLYSATDDDLLLRVPRLKINGTVSAVTLLIGMRRQIAEPWTTRIKRPRPLLAAGKGPGNVKARPEEMRLLSARCGWPSCSDGPASSCS